ncbi:epimerase [Mycolicibacterium chitae]|uniref:Dihydroflavonol-4-reductase n=1 Tax=Mycolicibacterium chitae TaxID=1792 RepID=A0A448I420_MYCCI|nr:NAD-dependent epimerase/dehydratase family protein [Mycolicibacterium chitae]MCV7108754.1 NAD-dependent epimerase/dehydratase family protein [Mycolicibacterium chitae]BBZ03492.1 epimerase [Mycolicibacterium chitae]VEG47083.1 dihydroflavonol-4-reductase [Mycolicibacterium chitae]
MTGKKLVLGASGFLGSHVTRKLVEAGEDVRVMLRKTSSTKAIDDLDVERCYGELSDADAVRAAMTGCDVLYYCVVDARMWLRDPAPLFRTNVDGLRDVLDVATEPEIAADLRKFVFTSTIGTLAISKTRLVTEDDPRNWDEGGAYIEARVAAEDLLFDYVRDRGLPGVAMCVSTTYGPGDWQPTPHGGQVAMVAAGKMPFYPDFGLEVVGIEDAARAMLLAADKGRVGERYIISDRFMTMREIQSVVAEAAGVRPARIKVPLPVLRVAARLNDVAARLLRRDLPFAAAGQRMAELMSPLDHGKAERELGWKPEPVEESLARAVAFFRSRP